MCCAVHVLARQVNPTASTSSDRNWRQCPQGAALSVTRVRPPSPCQAALATRNCSLCTLWNSGRPGNSRFTPTYRRPEAPSPTDLHARVMQGLKWHS